MNKPRFNNLNTRMKDAYNDAEIECIKDTQKHINKVRSNIDAITYDLNKRAAIHDRSKLFEPELTAFAVYGPKLRSSTYGSDDYMKRLDEEEFKKGLDHHYANNSHHPEYYTNGIKDMTLLDILEMIADWKAACERHDDGNLRDSFEYNRKRFNISDELYNIMVKTAEELEWL